MKRVEEVEIKFKITDPRALNATLKRSGFQLQTRRTFESNILYDFPDRRLRKRGELIRVRLYGRQWTLTFKAKATAGKHKRREEIETSVADGRVLETVLIRLGMTRSFVYEKYRTEWSDGAGHVVIDETPIGLFGEIEGTARWIDKTARTLAIEPADYITRSYGDLFLDWKKRTRSRAQQMTFTEIKPR